MYVFKVLLIALLAVFTVSLGLCGTAVGGDCQPFFAQQQVVVQQRQFYPQPVYQQQFAQPMIVQQPVVVRQRFRQRFVRPQFVPQQQFVQPQFVPQPVVVQQPIILRQRRFFGGGFFGGGLFGRGLFGDLATIGLARAIFR